MQPKFGIRRWQAACILGALALSIAAPASANDFRGRGRDPFRGAREEHWGAILRNTIGSPVTELRFGPFVPGSAPPFGKGSLGIEVSDNAMSGGTPQEKADFGNEVDFAGVPVSGLNQVGFYVFQTGENADRSPGNMPNIQMEISAPPVTGYSSMVWVPDPAPVTNQWSDYLDATTTGYWYFTNGSLATATGCGQSQACTFTDAMQNLMYAAPSAVFLSIAIGKGRDYAWAGAVDGLRINDSLYDFEPGGVKERHVR